MTVLKQHVYVVIALLSSFMIDMTLLVHGYQFKLLFPMDSTKYFSKSLFMSSLSSSSQTLIPSSLLHKYKNTYYGLRHGESEANVAGVISSDYTIGSTIHGLTETGRKQSQESAHQLLAYLSNNNNNNNKLNSTLIEKDLLFFSSNFTRARQTAQECLNSMYSILLLQNQNLNNNNIDTTTTTTTKIDDTISNSNLPSSESESGSNSNYNSGNSIDSHNNNRSNNNSINNSDIMKKTYTIRNELRERYFGQYDGLALHYYANVWPLDWKDADNSEKGVESVNQTIQRLQPFISDMESQYNNKHIVIVSHADTLQIMQTYMCGADVRQFSQYRFKNGEVRPMLCLPPPQPLAPK